MLPTARACLIYRGRTLRRAKSSTAPLGSEPIPPRAAATMRLCFRNDTRPYVLALFIFVPRNHPRSIVKIIDRSSAHPRLYRSPNAFLHSNIYSPLMFLVDAYTVSLTFLAIWFGKKI